MDAYCNVKTLCLDMRRDRGCHWDRNRNPNRKRN